MYPHTVNGTFWWILAGLLLLGCAVAALTLLVKVWRARTLLKNAGVRARHTTLLGLAVVYTLWPVDLLPDPVYLDDIGVLLLALRTVHGAVREARAGAVDGKDG
ncbi:hypothetical protein ACN20G_00335 [Streptomyces sp. BI20]|uniref:hypothetical protein n=1 Tax=Streptomyces sp. BI20 TaxID=3403460 RepID=UPI003C77977E